MPPPRPPPPSREPSSGSGKLQDSDEEDILTEEEEEGVCNSLDQQQEEDENPPRSRAVTNPRLYQLTSLGQSTGLWWDSFEEDLEELGLGGEDKCWGGFTGASNKSVFSSSLFLGRLLELWPNHLNNFRLGLLVSVL